MKEAEERKIVEMFYCRNNAGIRARCDDGSIWELKYKGFFSLKMVWVRLDVPPIPQEDLKK